MNLGGMSLDADSRVVDHMDRQVSLGWPPPVDVRLDRLLDQARRAGERTSRKELVAALVATCHPTDAQLGNMIKRYRRLKVREIMPVPEGENVVPLKRQPPGPRTRTVE